MTESEALKLVAVLAAAYPRQAMGQASIRAYASMLGDLDYPETDAAVRRIICSSKWLPSIAEVRAEVAEAACGLEPGEMAWGEVQRAIGRWGAARTPEWSTPELAAAVGDIGWRNICHDTNVASTRARLIEAYRARRERALDGSRLGKYSPGKRRLDGGSVALKELVGNGVE